MKADKEKTLRRVYALPTELVDRIVAYQNEIGLTSEVEAARRLLDQALQARDTVETLLDKARSRLASEKDLRTIATEILMPHNLVQSVGFDTNGNLDFQMKDGVRGSLSPKGKSSISYDPFEDRWEEYPKPKAGPDDDIPF